jgi:hypothetical protein
VCAQHANSEVGSGARHEVCVTSVLSHLHFRKRNLSWRKPNNILRATSLKSSASVYPSISRIIMSDSWIPHVKPLTRRAETTCSTNGRNESGRTWIKILGKALDLEQLGSLDLQHHSNGRSVSARGIWTECFKPLRRQASSTPAAVVNGKEESLATPIIEGFRLCKMVPCVALLEPAWVQSFVLVLFKILMMVVPCRSDGFLHHDCGEMP